MERLERVVRVDGDLALQILNFECNHTGLSCVQVGEVLLTLDDVLQLPPHEDTPQEPVHGGDQATAARTWQWAGAAQLIKCLASERGGNGSSPKSLRENSRWCLVGGGGEDS